jgi:hypothetical protein
MVGCNTAKRSLFYSNQNSKRDENLVFKAGFDLRHDTGSAFLDFARIRFLNKN